ncbi:hypothetical protein [Nocardia suismassiliense]|uniref:hypothetical protein n=1 Tax=Nocardia suismassiliense TaxID=2077092 RepID=UPI00131EF3BC|nr:hypothetical protein [Nocardia suismassiliense]
MTPDDYKKFVDELVKAAALDGITQIDVRLKGSSGQFYSGRHKQMAYNRDQIGGYIRQIRGDYALSFELDAIMEQLVSVWDDPDNRPHERPFDSYWRLGISGQPSDYDIQICSNTIAERARERLPEFGLTSEYDDKAPTYGYIDHKLVERAAPRLLFWSRRETERLRRPVTIAAFPSEGPHQLTGEHAALSNHLRSQDWIIWRSGTDE